MADVKLLPCPFCGGDVDFRESHVLGEGGYILHRENHCLGICGALSELYNAALIAKWNARTAPALTPELIERVLKFVGEEQLRALPTVEVRP